MTHYGQSGVCDPALHFSRRTLLAGAAAGLAWLTPVAELLARRQEREDGPPQSVIMLWLNGGPSQLETFDPHPGTEIAAGTGAIGTAVRSIQLAEGMERTAEQMDSITLIRSMVSQEGDHERAMYNLRTGYRPDPTLQHPSLGAIVCHQLPATSLEIPRHVSILPGQLAGRGGYLGSQYDAFQIGDPQGPLPDMQSSVPTQRYRRRLRQLERLEGNFLRHRVAGLERRTAHWANTEAARQMMDSEQLHAFQLDDVPQRVIEPFGDTPFGRGCLVAGRLIEAGVRCVEVTLDGWDSHVANREIQSGRKKVLDPAFAALIGYLRQRSLLERTIVVCGGEFGRTPQVNPAGGRDHWPRGFSVALAGGGLPGGHVIGQTDPQGTALPLRSGVRIADVHATILARLGIRPDRELQTPVGRPMKLSDGQPIAELLDA